MTKSGRKRKKKDKGTRRLRADETAHNITPQELNAALAESSSDWANETFKIPKPLVAWSFSRELQWQADNFLRLPASATGRERPAIRVALISLDITDITIALELCGPTVIGRGSGDGSPDLDLSIFSEQDFGISRRHAMIRPTDTGVELTDIGSTNGTRRNGTLLNAGASQAITDKDIVTFGAMQFQLRLVDSTG